MGMPTLSLMTLGAAPVAPLTPSRAIMSAPALTMPLAIAAELWTAAIFTETGLV